MKDKQLILYCEPCKTRLGDPEIQSVEDAWSQGETPCPYYPAKAECGAPRRGCIAMAGTRVARHVLKFYSEATEETLSMEVERFAREAPLPPDGVEEYVDTGAGFGLITDSRSVVERVRDYARVVLDLKPGQRIFRSPEEHVPRPEGPE